MITENIWPERVERRHSPLERFHEVTMSFQTRQTIGDGLLQVPPGTRGRCAGQWQARPPLVRKVNTSCCEKAWACRLSRLKTPINSLAVFQGKAERRPHTPDEAPAKAVSG